MAGLGDGSGFMKGHATMPFPSREERYHKEVEDLMDDVSDLTSLIVDKLVVSGDCPHQKGMVVFACVVEKGFKAPHCPDEQRKKCWRETIKSKLRKL